MPDAYETGAIYGFTSPALPAWQRTYYEEMLLDTIRTQSLLVPYARIVEDFSAVKSKSIVFTEIFDMEPNWNTTSESTLWKSGGQLDSRTVSIGLNAYHDIVKWSDWNQPFTYFDKSFDQIVREKLGQSLVDTMDILMRNALLEHPNVTYAGSATSRATLTSADLFDPDIAEDIRAHMEDHDVPGVFSSQDSGNAILCITSPRVIHDIRTAAGSAWWPVNQYANPGIKLRYEAGTWAGVRFIKSNRMRLRNHGAVVTQTTLSGATVAGQGAASTVDTVYTPGQSGSTRYVGVTSSAGFVVGQYVTIHADSLGTTVLETDGSQETRRIVAIDSGGANRLSFDRPLLKAHASGNYVTKALDIHASAFLGGPSVLLGIAERPNLIFPPKYDDAMMINRLGWRGLFKFQQYRPEWYEVHLSAGSADTIGGD